MADWVSPTPRHRCRSPVARCCLLEGNSPRYHETDPAVGSWPGLSPSRFHWYPDLAYIGCAQHDLHGAPVVCQIYASKDERRPVLKLGLELAYQDWIAKVLVR